MNQKLIHTILLSCLPMLALSQYDSSSYTGLYNQQKFIDGIISTVNEFRKNDSNVQYNNIQWDQELANCAFVTACFRHTYEPQPPHGWAMGMRSCRSYTCGGVTCNFVAITEGAFQFDIRTPNGYQNAIKGIVENPDGGHELPIISPKTTRIGCATHIADKSREYNANLYCDYSELPDCYDDQCCEKIYFTFPDKCKAKVASGEPFYFRTLDVCESFPNADDTIPANRIIPYSTAASNANPTATSSTTADAFNVSATDKPKPALKQTYTVINDSSTSITVTSSRPTAKPGKCSVKKQ